MMDCLRNGSANILVFSIAGSIAEKGENTRDRQIECIFGGAGENVYAIEFVHLWGCFVVKDEIALFKLDSQVGCERSIEVDRRIVVTREDTETLCKD